MRKMKCKTVIIAILMLISITVSAFTVQAAGIPRTVYGTVYIDGNPAPDGTAIKITFPYEPPEPLVIEMYTDENGNYSVTFPVDNWADGDFLVYYLGAEYTPTPSSIAIWDAHEIIYHVDLYVTIPEPPENSAPNQPTLVNPTPSGTTISGTTSTTLQVSVSDPDGDPMDVSFYNAAGDVLIGTVSAVSDGATASQSWSGLSPSTTYSWYATADDGEFTTQSATWTFTTAAEGGGDGNGGGGGGGTGGGGTGGGGGGSTAPTADANGPYFELYDYWLGYAEVAFDGSGSTGGSLTYSWDFGDGGTSTEQSPTHKYYGDDANYTVTLTVTNPAGSNTSSTYAVITPEPNTPPTAPAVSGEQSGSADTDYTYSAVSTDDDAGDQIKYTFDWDDGTTSTTEFHDNNTAANETHNWSAAGVYTIGVTANDNATDSGTTSYIVLIDAMWVQSIGYMLDTDGDGTYNTFYSNETGEVTDVEEQTDGTYYIDSDGTEGWDWVYDPDTDTLTEYSAGETAAEEDNTLLYVGAIILILLLLGLLWMLGKKKGKKPEEKKPETKKKTKKKK